MKAILWILGFTPAHWFLTRVELFIKGDSTLFVTVGYSIYLFHADICLPFLRVYIVCGMLKTIYSSHKKKKKNGWWMTSKLQIRDLSCVFNKDCSLTSKNVIHSSMLQAGNWKFSWKRRLLMRRKITLVSEIYLIIRGRS